MLPFSLYRGVDQRDPWVTLSDTYGEIPLDWLYHQLGEPRRVDNIVYYTKGASYRPRIVSLGYVAAPHVRRGDSQVCMEVGAHRSAAVVL